MTHFVAFPDLQRLRSKQPHFLLLPSTNGAGAGAGAGEAARALPAQASAVSTARGRAVELAARFAAGRPVLPASTARQQQEFSLEVEVYYVTAMQTLVTELGRG